MALTLVNWSERKQPPTSRTIVMVQCGVEAVKRPFAARKHEPRSAFDVITARKPERRRMRAARVFMNSAPAAAAKVSSPDCNGESPKPTWSIRGSGNGIAPVPIRKRLPPRTAVRKVRWRRSRRSITGCAVRRACTT